MSADDNTIENGSTQQTEQEAEKKSRKAKAAEAEKTGMLRLLKNFGLTERDGNGIRHRFWPKGTEFHPKADREIVQKMYQEGAQLEEV